MARESAFAKEMLRRHGARKDLRLFRNTVGTFWAGRFVERTAAGLVTLAAAAQVHGGLPEGSADYIGIRRDTGKLISLEVKREEDHKIKPGQIPWRDMILSMGGDAAICSTMAEVDALLGEP